MTTAGCHVLLEMGGRAARADRGADEIRLFSKCRNEQLRLPAFLRHYRSLGVQRFFIADNASTDGSAEYLLEQPDVHVFRTEDGFRAARGGTDWLNALLGQFGGTHWCVTVDIDELLCFPGSETVGLKQLTSHLDGRGDQALACLLLDLYPGGQLGECHYAPGDDLVSAAPFFDRGPYDRIPHVDCPGFLSYGGVRERVFFPESWARDLRRKAHVALYHRFLLSTRGLRDSRWLLSHRPVFPPLLTKVPLVKWDDQSRYLNVNHFVSPKVLAPESGALLHFKLLQDFHERALAESKRGQYYDGAVEFQRYSRKLAAEPTMTFLYEGSIRFENTTQLTRLGLMSDTKAWSDARARGGA